MAISRCPLIVATLMCAAVMTVRSAWAINCDVVIPPTTFVAPMYRVNYEEYTIQTWLVSPSAPSNVTPSGSNWCGYATEFARYDVNGVSNDCISASATSTLTPTPTGCMWSLSVPGQYYEVEINFNIVCDPNANAAIVPPANVSFTVTPLDRWGREETYSATVTSNLVCGAAPLFRIAKKQP